jgi:outer membrane immunogenic protein
MLFRVASLLAALLCLGASTDVFAAGRAANWTGWYVGGNLGYGWGHSDVSTNPQCGGPGVYFNCINKGVVAASGTGSLAPKGFTGGVQAGYNFQNGSFVLGGEVDFGAFNLKDSRTGSGFYLNVGPPPLQFFTSTTISTDWLFTARGRLGWAASPGWLFYATGGSALANVKSDHSFRDRFATGAISSTSIKAGWTVGAGAELMVSRDWTVKAEYLHVDFGDVSTDWNVKFPAAPSVSGMTTSGNLTANIARVGASYKFH